MFRLSQFCVVGMKIDGTRVILSKNATLDVAERVRHMLLPGSDYRDIGIEDFSKKSAVRVLRMRRLS